MRDILIIGLSLICARYFTEFLCSFIAYKQRMKIYKDVVDKYDLDVDLPKSFKEWRSFNLKMIDYHKNIDIVDYLYYLDRNNVNGKFLEDNNE